MRFCKFFRVVFFIALSNGLDLYQAMAATDDSPHGVWSGSYKCGSAAYPIEFVINVLPKKPASPARDVRAAVTFDFADARGQDIQRASIEFRGGYGPIMKKIEIREGWRYINRPARRIETINTYEGRFNPEKRLLELVFNGANGQCAVQKLTEIPQPVMLPSAWAEIGITPEEKEREATIASLQADGYVTSDKVVINLMGGQLLEHYKATCLKDQEFRRDPRRGGRHKKKSVATLQLEEEAYCATRFNTDDYRTIGGLAPVLVEVDPTLPGDKRLEKVRRFPAAKSIGDGLVEYDDPNLSQGKCLAVTLDSFGGTGIPVRGVQAGDVLLFKTLPKIDPKDEQRLTDTAQGAADSLRATEASIPRLKSDIASSSAWNGSACVRPQGDPELPEPPTIPDDADIAFNAGAFCYEVLERRMNPINAEAAMRAAFLDQVIGLHQEWKKNPERHLACATRAPSQMGDIITRIFEGGLLGEVAIQTRYQSCVADMIQGCRAPLAQYQSRVADIRAAHIAPYQKCESDTAELASAERRLPGLAAEKANAQQRLDDYLQEISARPKQLSLSDARCP